MAVLTIRDALNQALREEIIRDENVFIMIVVNCLAYGIYVALSKNVIIRNGTFRSMMWVFIFASLVCIPMSISRGLANDDHYSMRTEGHQIRKRLITNDI